MLVPLILATTILLGPERTLPGKAVSVAASGSAANVVVHVQDDGTRLLRMADGVVVSDVPIRVGRRGFVHATAGGALVGDVNRRAGTVVLSQIDSSGRTVSQSPLLLLTERVVDAQEVGDDIFVLFHDVALSTFSFVVLDAALQPITPLTPLYKNGGLALPKGIVTTSAGNIFFIDQLVPGCETFPGFVKAVPLTAAWTPLAPRIIVNGDDGSFAAASDGADRLFATWGVQETICSVQYPQHRTYQSELDGAGNVINRQETKAAASPSWNGFHFILCTPDGNVASVDSAQEMPRYVPVAPDARNATAASGDGWTLVTYSKATSFYYRWVTTTSEHPHAVARP